MYAKEVKMELQELKKILATLSIAGLLTGALSVAPGCTPSSEGSCTGTKEGAHTEEEAAEEAPAHETPAPSS
jgi:radical SAM modification target selenobiotic family peptide